MYLQERLLRRGREDDNINAIAARIQFYKQRTLPAIKHFDDQGKLYVVRFPSISIVLMVGFRKAGDKFIKGLFILSESEREETTLLDESAFLKFFGATDM